MNNTPFKIAFWVMSLAFGLTALLTGLKPAEMRAAFNRPRQMALHRTPQPVVATTDHVVASTDVETPKEYDEVEDEPIDVPPTVVIETQPNIDSELTEIASVAQNEETDAPVLKEFVWAKGTYEEPVSKEVPPILDTSPPMSPTVQEPVQVAVADPDGDVNLGLETAPNLPSELPLPPVEIAPPPPPPLPPELGEEVAKDVLVPDPFLPQQDLELTEAEPELSAEADSSSDEVSVEHIEDIAPANDEFGDSLAELKQEILQIRLAEARRELQDVRLMRDEQGLAQVELELQRLRQQIVDLKLRQEDLCRIESTGVNDSSPEATPAPQLVESNEITSRKVASAEPESTLQLASAEVPGTITCTFNNSPIREVLQTLADQAGWKIVIQEDVEGRFTGQFNNAQPAQVLALALKANNLGNSRLGSYILIRGSKDSKVR